LNPAPDCEFTADLKTGELRMRVSAWLGQYREKMLQYNRTILDREIESQQIDKDSTDEEEIFLLLDELWGSGKDMDAVRNVVHKVSDVYNHIPDGTLPAESQEYQTRTFEKLELSLNQMVEQTHRPIAVPEEFKILATLTGGVVGPGFPMLQETTIVSAFIPIWDEGISPEELMESTGLLAEFGWEILVGFMCGASTHGGSAHMVYGRCTNPQESDLDEFGWIYVITYSLDNIQFYGSFFDYFNAYTVYYADLCNEGIL
jgi:hypothetical protein